MEVFFVFSFCWCSLEAFGEGRVVLPERSGASRVTPSQLIWFHCVCGAAASSYVISFEEKEKKKRGARIAGNRLVEEGEQGWLSSRSEASVIRLHGSTPTLCNDVCVCVCEQSQVHQPWLIEPQRCFFPPQRLLTSSFSGPLKPPPLWPAPWKPRETFLLLPEHNWR